MIPKVLNNYFVIIEKVVTSLILVLAFQDYRAKKGKKKHVMND